MQYAVLIYDDETIWTSMSDGERNAAYAEYNAFTKALTDAGGMRGGEQLEPTSTATTLRVRDGKSLVTDGPFAETKEQLGGFYLIEAATLDDALGWAARIPSARYGSIEVRPVVPTQG